MITASATGWGWAARALGGKKKKFSKLGSSFALSDANTWRRDGWAAAPPTFPAPLDFPAKDSIRPDLPGGRWRRGARVCARGGARVAAERLPRREPSPGLQEVPKSPRLPGPGASACRPASPSRLPAALARRPLLFSRALALSPSLRTRAPARSGPGV